MRNSPPEGKDPREGIPRERILRGLWELKCDKLEKQ